ncbi:cell division protein PerM [[Kitasatospora] papulosa]|uniref:cell division protein PerM n=1 Tax=[Kitasatospora] papulosa TaxID=1464011 RepID=UPI0036BDEEC3
MTERSPMLSAERSRSAALASAFVRGVLAAGLGLGSLSVLVMLLWISSPYPDSGPGGALHVASGLWLLAHGAELVRADTVGGHPVPVGTVPLLLGVLPVWLVHRAARDSAETGERSSAGTSAVGAFCAVSAGYLLVVLASAAYAQGGALPADRVSLAFPVTVVVAVAAAAGVWAARGRPLTPLLVWAPLRVQEAAARSRFRAGAGVALRSAAAGTLTLLGGGALLVAVALVWHAGAARESFLGLSGDWAGRISVLLLAGALVPNAAMWGASYGLGPGFALGASSMATPLAFTGPPALPDFPLLAAVPSHGPGTGANWAATAVPAVAGLVVARFVARGAVPVRERREETWGQGRTALVAGVAAVGCGIGAAVLASASGGPLGTGALAEFGPVWWLVGPAALAWTAVIGVPVALAFRAWRLREHRWGWRLDAADNAVAAEAAEPAPESERGAGKGPGGAGAQEEPYDFLSADPWHEEGAREARWAALKKKSGGLMADFSARARPQSPPRPAAVSAPGPVPVPDAASTPGPATAPDPASAPARAKAPDAASASAPDPASAPVPAPEPGSEPEPEPEPESGAGAGPESGSGLGPSAGRNSEPEPRESDPSAGRDSGPETPTGRVPDASGHPEPGRENAS